nr:endonuclease [Mimivirus sp.]
MKKIKLLNDIIPEIDQDANGDKYLKENKDTGVIYDIYNVKTNKSYIGKACSYVKHGKKNPCCMELVEDLKDIGPIKIVNWLVMNVQFFIKLYEIPILKIGLYLLYMFVIKKHGQMGT